MRANYIGVLPTLSPEERESAQRAFGIWKVMQEIPFKKAETELAKQSLDFARQKWQEQLAEAAEERVVDIWKALINKKMQEERTKILKSQVQNAIDKMDEERKNNLLNHLMSFADTLAPDQRIKFFNNPTVKATFEKLGFPIGEINLSATEKDAPKIPKGLKVSRIEQTEKGTKVIYEPPEKQKISPTQAVKLYDWAMKVLGLYPGWSPKTWFSGFRKKERERALDILKNIGPYMQQILSGETSEEGEGTQALEQHQIIGVLNE